MATTRSNSGFDIVWDAGRTFFHQKNARMRKALVKRKVYRTTLQELSVLTDRELGDLGIPRCSIKRMALEAAYGC
ncbi:DUF1127 domain-containing protein (plasmid) [Pseudorhodobacter turbinis]|uniref:DUF1127 domain-containing protein n=1 Tax=Pseudorhodobacter turbinis TaxID=2500533 RepID=A0A4P8ELD3_9RHOB|nr:DUF1127 domain-containing protein [Pseudorhodobacter turbinis]